MKIENNNKNLTVVFGVALEKKASSLTQGHVHGTRYEGWSQRYPSQ